MGVVVEIEQGIKIPEFLSERDNFIERYNGGRFHDVVDTGDRELYLEHLMRGGVGANESYGPFGFAIMFRIDGDMKEKVRRVELIGQAKEGRDMQEKPPTIMVPEEAIDQIVDYSKMTQGGRYSEEEAKVAFHSFLAKTGTFAEVALKPEFAALLPISKKVITPNGIEVNTAILACVDNSYPYLAEIVRQGWNEGNVMAISSANRAGEPTETDPARVWEIVRGKGLNVMILDNPKLREAFGQLDGLEPCSYTILQGTTGWGGEYLENDKRLSFWIMRQGNVSPGRVLEALHEAFPQRGLMVRRAPGLLQSKVLTNQPYCNLSREFPPSCLREALGFQS